MTQFFKIHSTLIILGTLSLHGWKFLFEYFLNNIYFDKNVKSTVHYVVVDLLHRSPKTKLWREMHVYEVSKV
jgi:hypothetical protein